MPTVAGGRTPAGSAGELALDFCREHRAAVAHILRTRGTQTNEVNRTAALAPALSWPTPPGEPLRRVELGASAGLTATSIATARPGVWRLSLVRRVRIATPRRVVCECVVDGELPAQPAPGSPSGSAWTCSRSTWPPTRRRAGCWRALAGGAGSPRARRLTRAA